MRSFEGLKDHICNPSKDWRIMWNPLILRIIAFTILWRIEGLQVNLQPFEGLHMQSFNPSSDCTILRKVEGWHIVFRRTLRRIAHNHRKDWRTTHSPSTLPRIMCSPSKDPSKDFTWLLKGLNDHTWFFNPLNITFVILGRVEGFRTITQPFEGPWMKSFNPSNDWTSSLNPLKDCMQWFKPSKDCKCNPSTLDILLSFVSN